MARELGKTLIPPNVIKMLEERERAVDKARAAVGAGATRVELTGDVSGVQIDGMPAEPGDRTLSRETRIQLGGAMLIIRPPAELQSAETVLVNARDDLSAVLADHGVASVADARTHNEAARDAAANARTLEVKIAGMTPAVPLLGIAGGASTLKTFVAGLHESAEGEGSEEGPDLDALTAIAAEADSACESRGRR
ncbi:hypothetical protein [Sphingomonas sp. CFBP 13733]|uniref:hypothetical protein n=1 Tax=Sphingomonas sp. CFBP 13733 TaxID=2775291 RepID=UPI00177AD470|nr:hypothetical protein [Sphingomonas sp. CFBP 13733]MBD8641492.1 hypothetical protein [Sphingomonas sp. CFBP 13733]